MELFGQCQSVDSRYDQLTEFMWTKTSLQRPTVPSLLGGSRYLTQLWVSEKEEPRDELHVSASIRSKVSESIRYALKLLAFREEHAIIQFWSPRAVGKHHLLTTIGQPFALGSPSEELFNYRKDSERNTFLVDKDDPEGDISPPARVFRRGFPEWASDLNNYDLKDFVQKDYAVRCNLHGYLALPVFDSSTRLCVGVLELLMSSKNTSYAFEVQQIHKALKMQNLISPQVFGSAALEVPNQRMQDELYQILGIIKSSCDKHKLPLAQTWAESASTSFNSHDKMIEKTCSSFDTSCVGKVCMISHSLPYYVRDLAAWSFMEACKEQHLDKFRSFVGKALLARGSKYCDDVTLLCEEEYPLVHDARISGLRRCFAISLHGEGDTNYVLEFFLPLDSKDSSEVVNLVQTIEQYIAQASSKFVLGQISPWDASYLSSSLKPQAIGISSQILNTLAFGMDSWEPERDSDSDSESNSDSESESEPDSESDLGSFVKTDSADVQSHPASKEIGIATSYPILLGQKTNVTSIHAGETSKTLKRSIKRKVDSLTMSAVKQHAGKPIREAAKSFGVSRSTLKRFCRENGIHSWPGLNQSKKTNHATYPKLALELTVKATYKDDMIKFMFPISSGILELKNKVAQKLDLKGRLNIKYKDEENDLLLITCDVDLHNLPEFLASNTNTSVKLLVELVSE